MCNSPLLSPYFSTSFCLLSAFIFGNEHFRSEWVRACALNATCLLFISISQLESDRWFHRYIHFFTHDCAQCTPGRQADRHILLLYVPLNWEFFLKCDKISSHSNGLFVRILRTPQCSNNVKKWKKVNLSVWIFWRWFQMSINRTLICTHYHTFCINFSCRFVCFQHDASGIGFRDTVELAVLFCPALHRKTVGNWWKGREKIRIR